MRKPSQSSVSSSRLPSSSQSSSKWRNTQKNIFDDSLDSPDPRSVTAKNPLRTTQKHFLLSTDSFGAGSSNQQSQDDTFDLLSNGFENKIKDKKENVDPFDLMMQTGVNNDKKPALKNKIHDKDVAGLCFSSPDTTHRTDQSSDQGAGGLFSSFSKDEQEMKPLKVRTSASVKLKRPPSYRNRTKKKTETAKLKAPPQGHNSTLDVEIKYVRASEEEINRVYPTVHESPKLPRKFYSKTSTFLTPGCKIRPNYHSTPNIGHKSSGNYRPRYFHVTSHFIQKSCRSLRFLTKS